MSASQQTLPSEKRKVRPKTYFSWGGKLWYIFDVSTDGEMAFVEDCVTERVQWLKTALFRKGMKEVKFKEC